MTAIGQRKRYSCSTLMRRRAFEAKHYARMVAAVYPHARREARAIGHNIVNQKGRDPIEFHPRTVASDFAASPSA